jgi:hypothetical protein
MAHQIKVSFGSWNQETGRADPDVGVDGYTESELDFEDVIQFEIDMLDFFKKRAQDTLAKHSKK